MTDAQRIVRRSLHDEIVARVRDLITDGDLMAGDKIQEAELCVRFGVSRTPLREALKALAAEGLVVLQPNRGATVARITTADICELFPILGALEALAGELACTRITDAEITTLRRDHDRMAKHYRRGEWAGYIKLNRAIHETIFAIAGNAALTALFQQVMVRTHSARYTAKKSAARWHQAMEDHEKIIAALEKRDGKALARILAMHLAHKAEMVREAMAALDQPSSSILKRVRI